MSDERLISDFVDHIGSQGT